MSLSKNIAVFKNWFQFYCERFGLLRKDFVLEMRNGTKLWVRPNTNDLMIARSNFVTKHYIRDFVPLKKDSTVVDVGAHIGCFSVLAAPRVSRVLSFEPEPSNYQLLKRNIELNKLMNITAFEMCVSGRSGEREFYLAKPTSTGSSTLTIPLRQRTQETPDAGRRTQKVRSISIADIIAQHNLLRIDFLKLDCEGAEHEIINSLTTDISARISSIVMEYHAIEGASPDTMQDKLQKLGFETSSEYNGRYIYATRSPAWAGQLAIRK
jgi:FkbM family methyltransferase